MALPLPLRSLFTTSTTAKLARTSKLQLLRPSTSTSSLLARTMAAATAPAKTHWLVILPDNEGALPKRMAVRPDHLKNLTPAVDAGFWKLGGATLAEPAVEGKPLAITGSVMLALAESEAEVLAALRKDVYAGEVWDFSKIQVFPFKPAFIKEL